MKWAFKNSRLFDDYKDLNFRFSVSLLTYLLYCSPSLASGAWPHDT